MTVREYIEHLQTLDQDKGIWVIYDTYFAFDPTPDDVADNGDEKLHGRKGLKAGDYVITAG